MNNVTLFDFKGAKVRTVMKNGQPWFVAKDVCDVLEIVNTHNAVAGLWEDFGETYPGCLSTIDGRGGVYETYPPPKESGLSEGSDMGLVRDTVTHYACMDQVVSKTELPDANGKVQTYWIVSEVGVYGIIFKSRKPEAAEFRRWVFTEVLPSIRKHGAYITPKKLEDIRNDPEEMWRLVNQLSKYNDKLESRLNNQWKYVREYQQWADRLGEAYSETATPILEEAVGHRRFPRRVYRIIKQITEQDGTISWDGVKLLKSIMRKEDRKLKVLMQSFDLRGRINLVKALWQDLKVKGPEL